MTAQMYIERDQHNSQQTEATVHNVRRRWRTGAKRGSCCGDWCAACRELVFRTGMSVVCERSDQSPSSIADNRRKAASASASSVSHSLTSATAIFCFPSGPAPSGARATVAQVPRSVCTAHSRTPAMVRMDRPRWALDGLNAGSRPYRIRGLRPSIQEAALHWRCC